VLRFGVALVLSAACSLSQAACYSVYDGGGELLLRTEQAPVDLQHRIGDVVREKFGNGACMVFVADGVDCDSADVVPVAGYTETTAYGAGRYGGFGRAAYPHVGPRGGQFRYTATGNKSYQRKGR
jgi:hypothetical protein